MEKMTAYFYKLTCITNLHAGSGEANYNVVDNEVERDPIKMYPIIHSSGIKGALREHFKNNWTTDKLFELFGSAPGKSPNDPIIPGSFKFLNAILGARPVRVSNGPRSSILATTFEQLEDILSLASALSVKALNGVTTDRDLTAAAPAGSEIIASEGYSGIEGFNAASCNTDEFKAVQTLLGSKDIAIVGKDIINDIPLPVVAHNYLENGISKNLWYEEFVPRGSVFFLAVMVPADKQELFKDFNELLISQPVQIGANASLGYGLCSFERLN